MLDVSCGMAGAAGSCKRILHLLEKWPVDKSKAGGRDLGEYLRSYIQNSHKENNLPLDPKYWDQQYLSIQKLVNNHYKSKYKRTLTSSATGLSAEECNIVLSNEFLKELKGENKSYFRKLLSFKPDENK